MPKKSGKRLLSPVELILAKVGMLLFLGIFLLGLGAELPLWTAAYRAFFIWLVFSLLGGTARISWKYTQYRRRESELKENLDRARREEERLLEDRRRRREQMNELVDVMERRAAEETEPASELRSAE